MKIRYTLFSDTLFIGALLVLLFNDHILKEEFGGLVTGKLSDFCGLFIFPFFWSALFPRQKVAIYLLSGLLFILWKTSLSTTSIGFINQILGTTFSRVVDLSDLIALLVLPISYKHLSEKLSEEVNSTSLQRIQSVGIGILSMVAFWATSQPPQEVKVNQPIGEKFSCNVNKETIFAHRLKPARGYSNDFRANVADTIFILLFDLEDRSNVEVEVWTKIYKVTMQKTIFEFDSLRSYTVTGRLFNGVDKKELDAVPRLTSEELSKALKAVINSIENTRIKDPNIFFINPKLDTTWIEISH